MITQEEIGEIALFSSLGEAEREQLYLDRVLPCVEAPIHVKQVARFG